jgi:hypothetical protein
MSLHGQDMERRVNSILGSVTSRHAATPQNKMQILTINAFLMTYAVNDLTTYGDW